MSFFGNGYFLLALTFGLFYMAKKMQEKTGWMLLNPILVTIALLIAFLKLSGTSYEKSWLLRGLDILMYFVGELQNRS